MNTYYVASNGEDSMDGLSESTAWRTIAQAVANGVNNILLKANDIWYETLLPMPSESGMKFGRYGEGSNPIIDGSEEVSGWTFYNDANLPNVWRCHFGGIVGEYNEVPKLFIDDEMANPREKLLEDVNSSRDWFYDVGDQRLYLYSPDGNPDEVFNEIRANHRGFCIYIGGPTDILIDGIDCRRAVKSCIKATDESFNVEIRNLELSYSGFESGFLQTGSASNTRLINVAAIRNGINKYGHGFYMSARIDNGDFYIEDCKACENAGYGYHIYDNVAGGKLVRPDGYGNNSGDIVIGKVDGSVRINMK